MVWSVITKQEQQMGPSHSPPDLSEALWVCLWREREKRGEVGSSMMHLLSPACQLTWWMNQFHINLMLSSYNWIIYTAQRHMGSDHFNPRWALDFCSQAIGLWPTVNILMFCWLSPANQLTPLKSNSHSIFLFGWEQKLLFQALGLCKRMILYELTNN